MGLRSAFRWLPWILLLSIQTSAQTPVRISVLADKPISEIQPTLWGIFFEDINFAADGGLYAELVKNRSFEFAQPAMGWQELNSDRFSLNRESGQMTIVNRGDGFPNHRFARFSVMTDNGYGVVNEGFRGMGIKKDQQYDFSVWASRHEGSRTLLRIELEGADGTILASARVNPEEDAWTKYSVGLTANNTDDRAKLNIWFEGKGVVDLDVISLFPEDTWKSRANGLRKDLVRLLADLKPGFLRFPGGCIVEGRELATRYQWKKTIRRVEEREMIVNRWNTEFRHRPAPDYFQTFGLGFYEYFLLAEDIGAEPLPILSCGMACQFNTAEVVPINRLDPYVQDALDLIEFANGSSHSKWGKIRSDMGHERPFNLKFIGVGNEQWGPGYIERYEIFRKAIKQKYPEMVIVSGSGPFPDGELFDYASEELRTLKAEVVDEHYYRDPQWFLDNASRYDAYDRSGPRIFAGEYAAQSVAIASPENKNNWQCALAEAAFMTGLERNADVVHLSSYAPLFAHVDGWQWTPDLIWFDNLSSFGTPNYYVQKLFSTNRGTHVVPMLCDNMPLTGKDMLFASAALDKGSKEIVLKVVNASGIAQKSNIEVKGVKVGTSGTQWVLSAESLTATNSIQDPMHVSPVQEPIKPKGNRIEMTLSPYSLNVVRIGFR